MAETALNFGPDWLRALAQGPSTSSQPSVSSSITSSSPPRYRLAQFRYGREEMLALMPKDPKKPEYLKKDTSKVVRDTFMMPLALTPHTEDEQRLWSSRSVNSDAALRAYGKVVPLNSMNRSGRGGSVDRGRGRGRGSYYQRGITYEDAEDDPPSFSRPKPIERSQSANEKDQRWDDRDRRFDRPYSGRGSCADDNMPKSEHSRMSNESWRKFDKGDDSDWRSSGHKLGSRGSWRNPVDKDRRDIERNPSSRSLNGNSRGSHMHQKTSGNHLPEWSVEESNEHDVVGTFDSTGAFLEPKLMDSSADDIYVSDEADEGMLKSSPEAKINNSKKTPKKSSSKSRLNSALKQSNKDTEDSKDEKLLVDKHSPKASELQTNTKTITCVSVKKTEDHVIKSTTVVQHNIVNNTDCKSLTLPNVPEVVNSTKTESVILNHVKNSEISVPSSIAEEDAFAHHKKATENMVAQWTEEEEQMAISQTATPVQEKDIKWFYQDPQGEIQGPFKSAEMLEWFTAGYFAMTLMVRRTFDEKYSQLGDLIKSWGRVPFLPGNNPPPVRVSPTSLPTPVTQTVVPNAVAAPTANQLPKTEDKLLVLQQQLLQQQLMQQQLLLRQAQLQQLLGQLKQQDNFTNLNTQQQQQVLMQQFLAAQHQMPRPNAAGVSEPPNLDAAMPLSLPILGLPATPLLKNDLSLWNLSQSSNPWPLNTGVTQPAVNSIWDIEPPKPIAEEAEFEKQKSFVEEQEKLRKEEELRLLQEKQLEEKRKQEELQRKQEEERLLKELQKQEEEKRKLEEQKRKEEEKRRKEEFKKLEEQKRREEEELRKQREEELRKIQEQKLLEELLKKQEEQRLEEMRRKEEELRKQKELQRQEEQRKLEEKRKKEEMQRKIEMEKELERIRLEKQKEAERQKEIEKELQLQRERQIRESEEELKILAEIKLKSQGPAWGIKNSQSETQLSLIDIQRLQEEKEKEEREERLRQQLQQQQALKQVQQTKNGLSWAKRSAEIHPVVKSLAEIQLEEAERLVQQQRNQKFSPPAPVVNPNVGVWGNTSHLNRITAAPPSWNMNSTSTGGFWDDAVTSPPIRKQTPKSNDSAFPALTNLDKPAATVHSNKSKNVRAKKEEDAVTKLFGNRKPTDEFTVWCTEALSAMPSSVDVPTFIAFLKDIESPYEVHDYVRSYLGDGKEPREFAKLFLDKRSKFRAKQIQPEENILWGPAPAVNPVVNKPNPQPSIDNDGNFNAKGKPKKRKNRMQKLDNSMLGFTVQSNPDRLNVGEIDHVDGM